MIAVDLGSDILGRRLRPDSTFETSNSVLGDWLRKLRDNLGLHAPSPPSDGLTMPSILEVLTTSIDIMQVRISRSRMAGAPPDFVVCPRLSQLHLLDFQRAKEAIEEGRRAVQRVVHILAELNQNAS